MKIHVYSKLRFVFALTIPPESVTTLLLETGENHGKERSFTLETFIFVRTAPTTRSVLSFSVQHNSWPSLDDRAHHSCQFPCQHNLTDRSTLKGLQPTNRCVDELIQFFNQNWLIFLDFQLDANRNQLKNSRGNISPEHLVAVYTLHVFNGFLPARQRVGSLGVFQIGRDWQLEPILCLVEISNGFSNDLNGVHGIVTCVNRVPRLVDRFQTRHFNVESVDLSFGFVSWFPSGMIMHVFCSICEGWFEVSVSSKKSVARWNCDTRSRLLFADTVKKKCAVILNEKARKFTEMMREIQK